MVNQIEERSIKFDIQQNLSNSEQQSQYQNTWPKTSDKSREMESEKPQTENDEVKHLLLLCSESFTIFNRKLQ